MPNFNDTNFDSSKLKRGSVLYAAKLSPAEEGKYALLNAYNLSWEGYKLYEQEFTYTGDVLSYIQTQLDAKAEQSTWTDNLENTEIKQQIMLYKTTPDKSQIDPPIVPTGDYAEIASYYATATDANGQWAISRETTNSNKYVWLSSIYAVFNLSNEFQHWSGPTSSPILLNGESGDVNAQLPYYEQRWKTFDDVESVPATWPTEKLPSKDYTYIGEPESNGWTLTPNYNGGIVYMTSIKVIINIRNNEQEKRYNGDWSTPMRVTGIDGAAQDPIQPVFKYQWHTSNTNAPSLNQNEEPGSNWKESPGNPDTQNKRIYLWMIQGQRQDNRMIVWDTDSDSSTPNKYWSEPVCLSGADGEPGKDGDDIEFIYRVYDEQPDYTSQNLSIYDKPQSWNAKQTVNYLGQNETGYSDNIDKKWTNNPTGVDATYKYEYCSYRRATGPAGDKTWGTFSVPFPWSIYGENGLDGDGVEYIYYVDTTTENVNPVPPVFNLTSFQKSEVYGNVTSDGKTYIWYDDPQQIDGATKKYQWVSTRKFRTITAENKATLAQTYPNLSTKINNLKIGDKIWFPYSQPELWNWTPQDGSRVVMAYKRTSSNNISSLCSTGTDDIIYPYQGHIWKSGGHSYDYNWCENPGNNTSNDGDEYLWMIQAYYTKVQNNVQVNDGTFNKYTLDGEWSTPVCLTGEPGHEGEDGADIEFIYYRTNDDNASVTIPSHDVLDTNYQKSDWPFYDGATNYDTLDGIKFIQIMNGGEHVEVQNLNNVYNTWTDNPLGVSPTYKYEYAAVRRKPAENNSSWGEFSPVFLWSKYGEDGIDGDGVEYIYYLSDSNQPMEFKENDNINNPKNWSSSSTRDKNNHAFQHNEYTGPYDETDSAKCSKWTDDPQGVSASRNYEYVSIRRKQLKTGSTTEKEWGSFSEPTLWSHYGDDAVVNMITVDSDNDMMGVAIDNNGVVKQTTTSEATMSMWYQNAEIYDYKTTFASSNYSGTWTTTQSSENTVYTSSDNKIVLTVTPAKNTTTKSGAKIAITINENTTLPTGNQLRITLQLTETSSTIEGENKKMFTFNVVGLKVPQIYQLRLDKKVISRDINNNYVDANNNNVVTLYPSVITSDGTLITNKTNLPNNLYVFYKIDYTGITPQNINNTTAYGVEIANNSSNTMYFEVRDVTSNVANQTITSYVKKVTVYLIYGDKPTTQSHQLIEGDDTQTNNIVMDRETIYVVSDGKKGNPGKDSKSDEYIYLLTNDIDFFKNENLSNYYKPTTWSSSTDYNQTDYPFNESCPITNDGIKYNTSINGYDANNQSLNDAGLAIEIWTDNPQGISEDYKYEFWCSREYNASSETWSSFGPITIRANWGHAGEDGDGVEYIYYLNSTLFPNKSIYNQINPAQWIMCWNNGEHDYEEYQQSEYIPFDTWTDNPSNVSEENSYEYVSVRKYKLYNANNFISDIKSTVFVRRIDENTVSDLMSITDSDEILTGLFNHLLEYTNSSTSRVNVFNYVAAYCTNNNLTKSSIYAAVNGTGKQTNDSNHWFYTILYFVIKARDSIKNNQKVWCPYSYPTLWAKYGEQGEPGGSGLTIDFDNPSLQVAVNSDGLIKDNQTISTRIRVYSGATDVSDDVTTVQIASITNNSITHALTKPYTPSATGAIGYTLVKDSNIWKYTFKTGDNDYNNNADTDDAAWLPNVNYYITQNIELQFTVTYRRNQYTKYITVIPIKYGEDGQDAELFELSCPVSTLHYNAMLNTPAYEPSTVQYSIHHVLGQTENEIISFVPTFDTIITTNGYAKYGLYYRVEQDVQSATNAGTQYASQGNESSINTNTSIGDDGDLEKTENSVPTRNVKGSAETFAPQTLTFDDVTWTLLSSSESDYNSGLPTDTLNITQLCASGKNFTSSTQSQTLIGVPTMIHVRLYVFSDVDNANESTAELWDEDTLEIIFDGINGVDGRYEEYIYYCPQNSNHTSINWTSITGNLNPTRWSANSTNQAGKKLTDVDDFIINGQENAWYDHPTGVDETHVYEYFAHRTFNKTTGKWNTYDVVGIWSHYGYDGKDGDGVEYIFAVGNDANWKTSVNYETDYPIQDPRTWWTFNENSQYQTTVEYINSSVKDIWKDDPVINLQQGQYQFVSIRKYRTFTTKDKNDIKNHNGILGDYSVFGSPYEIDDDTLNSLIGKKMWMPYSEPTIWSSNIKGDSGEDAITLDFTNDQINFAVGENKYPNVPQSKSTTLNIINKGDYAASVTISNTNINTGSSNNASKIKCTQTGSTGSSFTYQFSVDSSNGYQLEIPENGLEITFTVTLSHSTLSAKRLTKVLKICGQHNGENAVTYELLPTISSSTWNGTTYTPLNFNVQIAKYDGTNVSTLSYNNFGNLLVTYADGNTPTRYPYTGSLINLKTGFNGSSTTKGYVTLNLHSSLSNDTTNIIDKETIPIINHGTKGERGIQGFTGPIIRYCGEWNNTSYYCGGKTNNNYDGTSPVYKDIVLHNGKYYTPYHSSWYYWTNETWASGVAGTGYINKGHSPSASNASEYWTEATQFDFVATKLLYADQALINQISTHDLIATDSNGNPVAGVTSGKKMYGKGGSSDEIYSVLNSQSGSGWNHTITNNNEDDQSNVRIFAGQIWDDNNSYSLTHAPFNVRQDGTAYMSKANIVGNVNIGGNVDISGNVNIHGTNVRIDGDLYANTLALSSNSFYYNEYRMLPDFNENETKMHQLMFYGASNTISYLIPQPDTYLLMISSTGLTSTDHGGDTTYVSDKALYTLYSKYGDMSSINSNISGSQKFWLVTKTDLFEKIDNSAPTRISASITVTITNVTYTSQGVVKVTITRGATPSITRYGKTYSTLSNWNYHLKFKNTTYWRQKIKGMYMTPGDKNPDFDGVTPDGIIIGEVISNYQYAEVNGNLGPSTQTTTVNMVACAAVQYPNDTQGGVMHWMTSATGNVYTWNQITGTSPYNIKTSDLICTGTCILTRIN